MSYPVVDEVSNEGRRGFTKCPESQNVCFAMFLKNMTSKPPTQVHEKTWNFKKIEKKRSGKDKKKREILESREEGGPGQGGGSRAGRSGAGGYKTGGSRAGVTGFKNVASRTKLA